MTVSLSKTDTLLAEARAIKAEIARLEKELKVRTEALASAVRNVPGKHETDEGSFTVRENNTYSEDAMRAALLPGQVRRCTVPKLDKAAVKRLYPSVYAAAKRQNGVSVTIG